MTIEYKFNEKKVLEDIKDYVDKTYDSHYAQTKNYQAKVMVQVSVWAIF